LKARSLVCGLPISASREHTSLLLVFALPSIVELATLSESINPSIKPVKFRLSL
jgi:hypothetical protein